MAEHESETAGGSDTESDLDELLRLMEAGDEEANAAVVQLLYDDIRRRAKAQMRGQPRGWTLQPTDLIGELYLKLARGGSRRFRDGAHFLAFCAKAMRHTLVDYARKKRAQKRGGDHIRRGFEGQPGHLDGRRDGERVRFAHLDQLYDMIDLDEALAELEGIRAESARVVELKFFGKLTNRQVAEVVGHGTTWVEERFTFAKAWLRKRLG